MKGLTTCLWFDGDGEEAARFYTSLLPDSAMGTVQRAPADFPDGGRKGQPLTVAFTLMGRPFVALNGGPQFPFTEAVSLMVPCETQEEIDRLWDALIAEGGSPSHCGWLKDRFGLSWQIVPAELDALLAHPDPARAEAVMKAFLAMTKFDIAALRAAAEEKED